MYRWTRRAFSSKTFHLQLASNSLWVFLIEFKYEAKFCIALKRVLCISQSYYYKYLCLSLQLKLARQLLREPRLYDIEETMAELSYLMCLRTSVRLAVSELVFGSSVRQTLQGVLSAGVVKSVKYAYLKLQKGGLREIFSPSKNNNSNNNSSSSSSSSSSPSSPSGASS